MSHSRDTSRDVAIVGMAARFADADDLDQLWDNLIDRRASFGKIPDDRWDHSLFHSERSRDDDKTYVDKGAFIDDVESFAAFHFGIAPRRVQVMDPQHRLVLETTRRALEDAGWSAGGYDPEMMGTFVGVSTSEYRNLVTSRSMAVMMSSGQMGEEMSDEGIRSLAKSVEKVTPISAFSMPGTLLNMVAANVAHHWKLGGPAYTLDAACASSLVAVHDAVTNIRAGVCDTALAGGVYLNLTPETMIGFSRIGAISRSGECRPFDAAADGFLQGDGCGVVVLKRYEEAVADGDRIYGVIRGSGCNNDGDAPGPMAPSRSGQRRAIERAWKDSGLDPRDVGFVACHGTATPVGDPVEVGALRDVVGDEGAPVRLGSIKANVGHTMSAAGVAGLIHATLALHHGVVPPQASFDQVHEALEFEGSRFDIPTEPVPWEGRRIAAVSAFGFGGTNAHLVVEAHERAEPSPVAGPELVLISAGDTGLLARHARDVSAAVNQRGLSVADVSYTTLGRAHESARLAVVAESASELCDKLNLAAELLESGETGMLGPDVWAGTTGETRLGWLFPGQGAQRLNLCRDLYDRYPGFRGHFDRLDRAARDVVGTPLSELLFGDGGLENADERLTATEHCQPVMAALGLALAAWLREEFGITPDVSLGHSLGEFAAAANGGILIDEEAVRFVARRGRLMAELELDDFGSMAAVRADAGRVAKTIEGTGAVVANINRNDQTVVSGTTEAVAAAVRKLAAEELDTTLLNVSHAFHSPVVEPVRGDLAAIVEELELLEPNSPVVSAITCDRYGAPETTRKTFVEHAVSTVDFRRALEVAREGVDLFVEVGAGTTLSRFVADLDEAPRSVSLTGQEPDEARSFLRAIGALSVHVSDLVLDPLKAEDRNIVSLPATPLSTQRYWIYRDRLTPLAIADDLPEEAAPTKQEATMADDGLVELFRQQMDVLNKQVAIIAAQNKALGVEMPDIPGLDAIAANAGAKPSGTSASQQAVTVDSRSSTGGHAVESPESDESPAQTSSHAEQAETEPSVEEEDDVDYERLVLDAVASVSAFPRASLKMSQELAADLGFDSLMFVDLGTALQKALPSLGAIPQSSFNRRTTIGDVVDVLLEIGESKDAEVEEAADHVTTTLQRYQPVLVPRSAPRLPARPFAVDGTLLFATTGGPRSDAIRDELAPRGDLRVVDLHDTDKIGDAADASGVVVLLDARLPEHPALALHAIASRLDDPSFFVVITNGDAPDEQTAAVRGFVKSLAREWADVFVKAIDIDSETSLDALFAELDGPSKDVEVALLEEMRHVPALREVPFVDGDLMVDGDDIIVITGGSRGIGGKVARFLAERTKCGLVLVGRTEPSALASEAIETIEYCRNAGSKVEYIAWDVTEPKPAVFEAIEGITGIIHSAGVISDRSVESKTPEEVRTVTDVKLTGLTNLLNAVIDRPLRLLVGFSSWSGHFGNRGQTDYAAANAAIDAVFANLDQTEVEKAVSIGWPAWNSTDMVQNLPESARKMMAAEGLNFISDEVGIEAFRKELSTPGGGVVIYGEELPEMQRRTRTTVGLSLESHPYLDDHRLRGKAVLPFAAALDYAAITSDTAFPIRYEDVRLFRGVEIDEPIDLEVEIDAAGDRARWELAVRDDDKSRLVAYRGVIDHSAIESLSDVTAGESSIDLPFSLSDFYEKYGFHGPRIQGIDEIVSLGEHHVRGTVRTSVPSDWVNDPVRDEWAVDPLVVDSAFQLVAYWLAAERNESGFPLSVDRFELLEPLTGGPYEVEVILDDAKDDQLTGTAVFRESGRVVARMDGVTAQLIALETSADEDETSEDDFDPETWDVKRFPEVEALSQRLEMAGMMGVRNPYFHPHDGPARDVTTIEGREMINFSSYNYLGFSGDPEISSAAKEAVDRFGTSVSASRLASGQIPLHEELEDEIADLLGVGGALVFSAGHATNESVIGHLFDEGDLIITDSLAHNSILTGAELSGARRLNFKHNDYEALERMLKELRRNFRKVGVFIEGVYSMDGDIPNLPEFIRIRNKYKVLLYVDEAHSMGCIGDGGRGISAYYDIDPTEVDVWMGTLSKSFASCGGYVAASSELIEYLKYTAPGFIFSAGISPANTAAALASIRKLKANPGIAKQLQDRSDFFLKACNERGLDTGTSADSAVVPVIVGDSYACLQLSSRLADRGINVQPIVYPAVEDESSRLRFFLSATHTEDQLQRTAEICAEELAVIRSGAAAE